MLLEKRSWVHQALNRWVLHKADYVTCVSNLLAEKAANLGVPVDRLRVLYLGVDTQVFHPTEDISVVRAELGLPEGIYVASIRALQPLYHPEVIAKSLQTVLSRTDRLHFLLFTYNADPDILQDFQRRFAKYIQNGQIRLVENLIDDQLISKYYQAADIAISVPASDGTPKSVQEAMACEKAVIASDIPAIHEWIRPEETGLLVRVGDSQALTKAILQLGTDPDLISSLGTAARQEILSRADSRICMEKYYQLYQELAAGSVE
jgi:glycosyltransferase involved in cell wall biosynthesis